MKFLVIPTNRPERLHEFFRAWQGKGGWDKVIVVDDGPTISRVTDSDDPVDILDACNTKDVYHYCWSDIDRILGQSSWIISRRDSAIRCFGFLAAWHLGATSVLTLDDDCFPYYEDIMGGEKSFFEAHTDMVLDSAPVWQSSVVGQRTRGIPYKNKGTLKNVKVNVGLWTNNGDWDSIQTPPEGYFTPLRSNRIIPHGQIIPMCGMNLCFLRDVIPLMYFPLMGEGQPYSRFDDIWSGIIVKKLLDHLGWYMSVGKPFVEHIRASDPAVNKVKEAPGIEANEWFWEKVWGTGFDKPKRLVENPALECMFELGYSLSDENEKGYIHDLGEAMMEWTFLLRKKLDF